MQLHRLWQAAGVSDSLSGISESLSTINGIANAEQTHVTPQRSFRVTGNRICLNKKKHGYTSMDAAGFSLAAVNFFIVTEPLISQDHSALQYGCFHLNHLAFDCVIWYLKLLLWLTVKSCMCKQHYLIFVQN